MAKRKDAVALFEVITATKRKAAAAAAATEREPGSRAPKWWFKGRSRPAANGTPEPARDPNDPTAGVVLSPVYAPAQLPPAHSTAVEPATGALTAAPAVVHRVLPASYPTPAERLGAAAARSVSVEIPTAAAAPDMERPRRAWFGFGFKKLGLDPDRREVTLRFRYTTAIIAGFAILVALGLAYVTGRGGTQTAAGPNLSRSTEDIRRGDVLAHVLDIDTDRVTSLDPPPGAPQPDVERDAGPPAGGPPQAPVAPKPPAKPTAYEVGAARIIGLNYVIIQSYPKREDAEAARQALEAANIPCTVESTPKGFGNPKLWSVIGVHGFHRIKKVPEYQQYVDSILAVSKRFALNSKYREFEPAPMKWK